MMPQAEQKATTDQSNEEFHRQISCHLNAIYYSKLRPLEEKVNYFEEAFDCVTLEHRPIVLLVGPYSSGKTSFIE
ncbi:MAG: EH domain-containing protein 4 [Marteilia pararefringens]